MKVNEIPYEGRQEIMKDKALGIDNKTIYEKYSKKYGKYFNSSGHIKKNISSVIGHYTKGHKPRKN
jgi:hypothetical protein